VGTAYANRYLKKDGIVVASFGDGSSSTPDFHAAMNLAAVYNLPVIFFCENNGLAISLPTEKQTKVEIWKKAEAYGMPGILVNGSDMVDTYEKTREMVEYVRSGKGPVLIEARCPRMGPHSTSDDPTKYLTDIVKEGSDRDPLIISQKRLVEMGVITEQIASKIREDSQNFITSKFDELEKIPPPSPETLFEDVYEEPTWIIDEERGEIIGRN
jgi:TPP-dependent pyruvate/acetoin dehydrogenase alpha subunit